MQLVMIEWVDSAVSSDGWTSRDDYSHAHIVKCVHIGVLLKEDKDTITLCSGLNRSCKIQETTIPKCCIKRMRQLKVG
ncbi:hypothetical protein ES703_94068 [subsurface metagenome]